MMKPLVRSMAAAIACAALALVLVSTPALALNQTTTLTFSGTVSGNFSLNVHTIDSPPAEDCSDAAPAWAPVSANVALLASDGTTAARDKVRAALNGLALSNFTFTSVGANQINVSSTNLPGAWNLCVGGAEVVGPGAVGTVTTNGITVSSDQNVAVPGVSIAGLSAVGALMAVAALLVLRRRKTAFA